MSAQFLPVLITLAVAILTAVAVLGLAALVAQRSRHSTAAKRDTYEYLVALVFVVLDVEVAFLYPWAVTYSDLLAEYSTVILWDMLAFITLLALAYAYLWKKGVFDWGRAKRFADRGEG